MRKARIDRRDVIESALLLVKWAGWHVRRVRNGRAHKGRRFDDVEYVVCRHRDELSIDDELPSLIDTAAVLGEQRLLGRVLDAETFDEIHPRRRRFDLLRGRVEGFNRVAHGRFAERQQRFRIERQNMFGRQLEVEEIPADRKRHAVAQCVTIR